jgi:DNA-binding transcriptional ArsR family regulator
MHTSMFQALADPARLQIVEALRRGECAVNDIVERMEIHQSGVSRHLRILHEAGFVKVRADGPRRLYSLRPEPFEELESWAHRYRAVWEARLDRFAKALAKRKDK